MKGVWPALKFRRSLLWSVLFLFTLPAGLSAEQERAEVSEEPEGAVELRFQFDESTSYEITNHSRIDYEDRPDFQQIYHSDMTVEYRPLTEMQRGQLSAWPIDVAAAQDEDPYGQILLATVTQFSGAFDEPHELSDTAYVHPILKDASFSFRISERGDVTNVFIHPPTNPLARANLEEIIRLLATSHPVLPDEAVEPGDRWSHTIELSFDDESVEQNQEIKLEYHFKEWAQCGNSHCARIEVDNDVNASGTYVVRNLETKTEASGTGQGWFLLDPEQGQILRSQWNVDTNGNTITERRAEDTLEEVVSIEFQLVVDTTMTLVE